jgi:hypothetical protein
VRLTKVILDSLALRYAAVVATIELVTDRASPGIHIVGDGSMNTSQGDFPRRRPCCMSKT